MDALGVSIVTALSALGGIVVGQWMSTGRERRARLETARLETYRACIGSFNMDPFLYSLIATGTEETLKRAGEILGEHYAFLGQAKLFANGAVLESLEAAERASEEFSARVQRETNRGPLFAEAMAGAWQEIHKPALDELVKRMKTQVGIDLD